MSEVKNDNLSIRAPKPVDTRSMKLVSGVYVPYASVAEAHALIIYKSAGVPIYINLGGVTTEHQYIGGFAQSNLVPLPSSPITVDTLTLEGTGSSLDPLTALSPNIVTFNIQEIRDIPAGLKALPTTFKLVNPGRTYSTSDFTYDAADNTTPDDGAMHIRSASGGTYHRNITDDHIDVRWFGAVGDYATDDSDAIQAAIDYIIAHADCPKKLYMPRGQYLISKPIFTYKWDGTDYQFIHFEIYGDGGAKIGMTDFATSIKCMSGMGNNFMLGIQLGKGVVIRNIEFIGLYTKADVFTRSQIVRNKFSDWEQTGISHKRYAPHCGVIIDPFQYATPPDGGYSSMSTMYRGTNGSYGGSTDIKLYNCRFSNFDVCFALGINGYTLNGEDINVEDCDFNLSRVAYATGQTQTVGNTFRNFRVWTPIHTIIDGLNYGQTPGTPPHCHGGNIAGGNLGVYQLVNVASTTAAFVVNNLRAESIFKIGSVSPVQYFQGYAASFVDCEIHLWDPTQFSEMPTPDFVIQGKVNFVNTNIEYGDPTIPHRIKLNNRFLDAHFEGATLSPVAVSRPGNPQEDSVTTLSGVTTWQYLHSLDRTSNRKGWNTLYPGYLTQTPLGGETKIKFSEGNKAVDWFFEWKNNTPDKINYLGTVSIVNNTSTGTCTLTVSSGWLPYIKVGDMLMSDSTMSWSLTDRNPDLNAVDSGSFPLSLWIDYAPILGTITDITGNVVTLKGVGVNIPNGTTNNVPIYNQWIREHNNPIAVTITSGSPVLTNVENTEVNAPIVFGAYVGQRLEHPAIPDGTKVQSINLSAKTITLTANATGSFPHAQIINGQPEIKAVSAYDPSYAITNAHCNLFEGKWLEKRLGSLSEPYKYREWLINRATFSTNNGVAYVPSTLHPISVSRPLYGDDENYTLSGHIDLPHTDTNSAITIGGGEIQSVTGNAMALAANLFFSTNFGSTWVYRNNGGGSLISIHEGGLGFYTAPTGVGATSATLTSRFSIAVDGTVTISNLGNGIVKSTGGALSASSDYAVLSAGQTFAGSQIFSSVITESSLTGTGTRIGTINASGQHGVLANGASGTVLMMSGSSLTWTAISDTPTDSLLTPITSNAVFDGLALKAPITSPTFGTSLTLNEVSAGTGILINNSDSTRTLRISDNVAFPFIFEVSTTGRLDLISGSGQAMYLRSDALHLAADTQMESNSGVLPTSTATQTSSRSLVWENLTWTGSASSAKYSGIVSIANAGVNEETRLSFQVNASNPSVLFDTEVMAIFSRPSVEVYYPILVKHLGGLSAAPTIAAGTGAGTSPTVSIAGTDLAGEITVLTGTSPSASNTLVTITFNGAYASTPYVVASPSNEAAGNSSVYLVRVSATQFQLAVSTAALTAATSHKWTYIVSQ